jgi:hypothetical protein
MRVVRSVPAVVAPVLAAVLTARVAAAGDCTIVRRTAVDRDAPDVQTEYWSRGRLIVDDAGQTSVVDFGAGRFTWIDKDAKTYSVVSLDDVRRQLRTVGAVVQSLPPAARGLLGLQRRLALSATGNTTPVAGHEAREYGITGDDVTGWLWLAEDLDPTRLLGDDAARWWQGGEPLRIVGPLADVAQAVSDGKLRGMPMWVTLDAGAAGHSSHVTSEVVSVRTDRPPRDLARIPDGYRRTSSPLAP